MWLRKNLEVAAALPRKTRARGKEQECRLYAGNLPLAVLDSRLGTTIATKAYEMDWAI
jgi:hypothetical protein